MVGFESMDASSDLGFLAKILRGETLVFNSEWANARQRVFLVMTMQKKVHLTNLQPFRPWFNTTINQNLFFCIFLLSFRIADSVNIFYYNVLFLFSWEGLFFTPSRGVSTVIVPERLTVPTITVTLASELHMRWKRHAVWPCIFTSWPFLFATCVLHRSWHLKRSRWGTWVV